METVPVPLSKSLYDLVARRAATRNQAPARLVEEILSEELLPHHPYVEVIDSRSGPRPVIKGTRVGVDVIVGYGQAGYSPREIVDDVLTHLTLAQIYGLYPFERNARGYCSACLTPLLKSAACPALFAGFISGEVVDAARSSNGSGRGVRLAAADPARGLS
jgi:uncharacterized protein (DUF433 family)